MISAGVEPDFRERGYAIFRTRPRPPFAQNSPTQAFRECVLRYQHRPDHRKTIIAEWERTVRMLEGLPDEDRRTAIEVAARVESELRRNLSPNEATEQFVQALKPYADSPLHDFMSHVQEYVGAQVPMLFI